MQPFGVLSDVVLGAVDPSPDPGQSGGGELERIGTSP